MLLFLICLSAFLPPTPAAATSFTILGEVKGATGIDLKGVSVTLNTPEMTALTDDAGMFAITGEAAQNPGDLSLTVTLPGYQQRTVPLASYQDVATVVLEAEEPAYLSQVDGLLTTGPWVAAHQKVKDMLTANGRDPSLSNQAIREALVALHQVFRDLANSGSTLKWPQAKYALESVGVHYFREGNAPGTWGTELLYDRETLYRIANLIDMKLGGGFAWDLSDLTAAQMELLYSVGGVPETSPFHRIRYDDPPAPATHFIFPSMRPAANSGHITPGGVYLIRPIAQRIVNGAQNNSEAAALLVEWLQRNLFHTYRDDEKGEIWHEGLYFEPPWGNGTVHYPVDLLWYGGFSDFAAPLSERTMGCPMAAEIIAAFANSIGIPAYASIYESYYANPDRGGGEHGVTLFPTIDQNAIRVVHADFPLDHFAMPAADLLLTMEDFAAEMVKYNSPTGDMYILYSAHLKVKNRREMILRRQERDFYITGYVETSPADREAAIAQFLAWGVELECNLIPEDTWYRCEPKSGRQNIPIDTFLELLQGTSYPDPGENLLFNGGFESNLDGWSVNPEVQTGDPAWSPLLTADNAIARNTVISSARVSLAPDRADFQGTILHQDLNLGNVGGKRFAVSVRLTDAGWPAVAGSTVAVWVTYEDGQGDIKRVKVLNPENSLIRSNTLIRNFGVFQVPADARRIVKLELARDGQGAFHADDVILWAEGVTRPEQYVVTYDANDPDSGTAPADQTKLQGMDLTLRANSGNLAREGFLFAGWNTQPDGSGTGYPEGAIYGTDAALTLYARWVTIPYFMAKTSGNWSNPATWFTSPTGGTNPNDYSDPATFTPNAANSLGIIVNANVAVDTDVTITRTTVNAGATLTVNQDATLTIAKNENTDLDVVGALLVNGNLICQDGTTVAFTGGNQPVPGATYHHVNITGTQAKTLAGEITIKGDLIIAEGATLDVGADEHDIAIEGNWTNSGAFTSREGVVIFGGGYVQTITGSTTFSSLSINKEEATHTVDASGGTLVVTDTLQIASGKITSASAFKNVVLSMLGTLELSGNITVSGEWQNWFGTLEHNNHTVVLNGTDQFLGGSTTFYNLTKEVDQADTLTFMSGFGTTIEGNLTLRGAPGQLLSLRGDDPESQWEIDPRGARNITYVDVQGSRNIHETPINAGIGGVNSGNNERWLFHPTVTTQAVTNIATTTATGHGTIADLGVPNPTAHGVCWSTSQNPTTAGTCVNRGAATATGAFAATITGLTPDTTYFARAYATNNAGTTYGAQVEFQTASDVVTYTLTVNNGTGSDQYAPGAVATIQANAPATGKMFDKWTGDTAHVANVNNAATTVTMPAANITVTATYKDAPPPTYTLNVRSTGASGVLITASPDEVYGGSTNYARTGIPGATQVVLTAPETVGDAGFSGWNGCDTTNPETRTCTVTMNASKTVTARFGDDPPRALPGVLMLLLDE